MPMIKTKVNVKLDEEKEKILKQSFGEAISIIPGKSEGWLMLSFEDECRLYFRGDDSEPIAYIEVSAYGSISADAAGRLTGKLSSVLSETLGIAADHIYVKYDSTDKWGWNGGNF